MEFERIEWVLLRLDHDADLWQAIGLIGCRGYGITIIAGSEDEAVRKGRSALVDRLSEITEGEFNLPSFPHQIIRRITSDSTVYDGTELNGVGLKELPKLYINLYE